MRVAFETLYCDVNSDIVSNAYMVNILKKERTVNGVTFRVGFMSNLTREKGLFHFLDLADRANALGLPIKFVLAGPIGNLAELEETNLFIDKLSNLDYLGAIYESQKDEFFSSLDAFVFPTNYKNEAQPIVLYEAMAASVPVITVQRGCIREQIGNNFMAFSTLSQLDELGLDLLMKLRDMSLDEMNQVRNSTCQFFTEQHKSSSFNIKKIIT
jgi:glycosyltransferase involved in cell wall biosynthesis